MSNISPIPENPRMLDRVLAMFQAALAERLPWLDYACGRVTMFDEQGERKPKIYIGGGDYAAALPDDTIGNHSFFDVDPVYVFSSWHRNQHSHIMAKAGLVVWFNLNTVGEGLVVDNVKEQVLNVLNSHIRLYPYGSFRLISIADDAPTIFRRFARPGYQERYLMHPYAGIRFDMEIKFVAYPEPEAEEDDDADVSLPAILTGDNDEILTTETGQKLTT